MTVCHSRKIQKKVRILTVWLSRIGWVGLTGLDKFSKVLADFFGYIFFWESDFCIVWIFWILKCRSFRICQKKIILYLLKFSKTCFNKIISLWTEPQKLYLCSIGEEKNGWNYAQVHFFVCGECGGDNLPVFKVDMCVGWPKIVTHNWGEIS